MIPLSVKFDERWDDLKPENVIYGGSGIKVVVLSGGMASGKASVAIRIDLPDGRTVVAETSARLFASAGRMITAKYPDLFEGD